MDIAQELERRAGHPVDRVLPSPLQSGYRARIDLSVGPDGRLGYFLPRSHEHRAIDDEPLARPEIREWLPKLAGLDLRGIGRVELRSDGEKVIANAKSPPKRRGKRAVAESLPLPDVALDGKTLRGDCRLRIHAGGIEHHVSPGSFYQINLEVNRALVDAVTERIQALSPAHLLDLYAGIGNLSLPSVAQGTQATLVERSGSSTRDARSTLKRLNLQATIREQDAGKLGAGEVFADCILLDPPRAGAPGLLEKLIITRPRAILYVSCNAATLGRDLGPVRKAGYRITELWGLEMFPGTEHFEAMAVLER
ncbi:MAG: RsmD family RNA methyltransferase [Myxococcota bacterium]|nr:RsmD family RNA methyltransferase [Myxococcota bacterium]